MQRTRTGLGFRIEWTFIHALSVLVFFALAAVCVFAAMCFAPAAQLVVFALSGFICFVLARGCYLFFRFSKHTTGRGQRSGVRSAETPEARAFRFIRTQIDRKSPGGAAYFKSPALCITKGAQK